MDDKIKIFDRFVQADNTSEKQFDGAGLGLSIVKAYVEKLGGEIWIKSVVGKGSEFYFTIINVSKTNYQEHSEIMNPFKDA